MIQSELDDGQTELKWLAESESLVRETCLLKLRSWVYLEYHRKEEKSVCSRRSLLTENVRTHAPLPALRSVRPLPNIGDVQVCLEHVEK